MASVQTAHAADSRVRFVFNETVRSFNASASTTFEEIAQMLDTLPSQRFGNPIAIDLTLASR